MKKILFYILAVFTVVSCGNSYEAKKRIDRERQLELQRIDSLALKVAVVPTLDCLPVYLAKDERLFDTLGVDVHLKIFNAQIDCDQALMRGAADGMVSDLVRTERLRLMGTPMQYVSSTGTYWQLFSNHKARLKALDQMGDKMIAMTRFSATDCLSQLVFEGVKTKSQVYNVQINDVQIRLRMLLNNEMDAVWLTEPLATAARLQGHRVMADSRDKKLSLGVVAFKKKAVADARRRKQLAAFTKAYNMACDSLNKNGLKHYSVLLQKYYKIDKRTINALPKSKFQHVAKPQQENIDKAAAFAKTTIK
jgi:NitT/TauT family transport system substrate-binding protein